MNATRCRDLTQDLTALAWHLPASPTSSAALLHCFCKFFLTWLFFFFYVLALLITCCITYLRIHLFCLSPHTRMDEDEAFSGFIHYCSLTVQKKTWQGVSTNNINEQVILQGLDAHSLSQLLSPFR